MLLDEGKSVWICACCREKVESNRSMSYAGLRELCTPDAVKNFRVEGADAVVATRLASADHVAAVSSSGAHDVAPGAAPPQRERPTGSSSACPGKLSSDEGGEQLSIAHIHELRDEINARMNEMNEMLIEVKASGSRCSLM